LPLASKIIQEFFSLPEDNGKNEADERPSVSNIKTLIMNLLYNSAEDISSCSQFNDTIKCQTKTFAEITFSFHVDQDEGACKNAFQLIVQNAFALFKVKHLDQLSMSKNLEVVNKVMGHVWKAVKTAADTTMLGHLKEAIQPHLKEKKADAQNFENISARLKAVMDDVNKCGLNFFGVLVDPENIREYLILDDKFGSGMRAIAKVEYTEDSSGYSLRHQAIHHLGKFRQEEFAFPNATSVEPKIFSDAELKRNVKTLAAMSAEKMNSCFSLVQSRMRSFDLKPLDMKYGYYWAPAFFPSLPLKVEKNESGSNKTLFWISTLKAAVTPSSISKEKFEEFIALLKSGKGKEHYQAAAVAFRNKYPAVAAENVKGLAEYDDLDSFFSEDDAMIPSTLPAASLSRNGSALFSDDSSDDKLGEPAVEGKTTGDDESAAPVVEAAAIRVGNRRLATTVDSAPNDEVVEPCELLGVKYNSSVYKLCKSDLMRLKDNRGWYSDELVIINLCLALGTNQSTYLFDSFALSMKEGYRCLRGSYPPSEETQKFVTGYFKPDRIDRKFLVVPVHICDSHWIVLIVTNPSHLFRKGQPLPQILVFDPLQYSRRDSEEAVEFMKRALLLAFDFKERQSNPSAAPSSLGRLKEAFQVVHVDVHPKQADSWSCGPFVILCAKHFIINCERYLFKVR